MPAEDFWKLSTVEFKVDEHSGFVLSLDGPLYRLLYSIRLIFLVANRLMKVYVIIVVPLKLSFYLYTDINNFIYYGDRVTKVFFALDLLMRFFTPVYTNHELEYDHKFIA